jgi:hypothetical protein
MLRRNFTYNLDEVEASKGQLTATLLRSGPQPGRPQAGGNSSVICKGPSIRCASLRVGERPVRPAICSPQHPTQDPSGELRVKGVLSNVTSVGYLVTVIPQGPRKPRKACQVCG